MDLVAGQSLGRYEIVGILGAGGMGEVYRARDTQLGRDVAVKVISSKVAQSRRAIDRFEQEAKAVAQLSHPNILDIHDFGRDGGVVYAVTELLEGNDLRDRMRGSMLPLSKALEIGIAVANGLAAAHSKGIIHRDIKPDNIFVTSTGQVKILDFGIAGLKAGSTPVVVDAEARTESLTMTGDVLGTVGYMSPEQVRGEKVDQRSDIFALGCLLYEVLTGRRAFQGETSHDTILAILNRDPDSIADHRPDIPPGLEAIVRRCLEKQPDERFESARDVAFALQALSNGRSTPRETIKGPVWTPRRLLRWGAAGLIALLMTAAGIVGLKASGVWPFPAPPLPDVRHVAVIPFESSGKDPELAELAAGLSEIISSELALAEQGSDGGFWVVPPVDTRYMQAATVDDMYRAFNTTIALTGLVEGDTSDARVTLTLIDQESSGPIRSSVVEGHLGNVSSLQLDPFSRVIEMLELEGASEIREWIESETTNVAQAFMLYVRGTGALVNGSETGTATAVDLLEQATALDPMFAAARESLARALLSSQRETGDTEFLDRAMVQLQEALAIRPASSTYRGLADLFTARGELDEAAETLEQATRLAPRDSLTFMKLGRTYHGLGRIDDAERAYQRAINLRPGYWPGPNRLANLYYNEGKFDAAANEWRQVIADAPLCSQGYNNLGAVFSQLGRSTEARAMFEKSIEIDSLQNYSAYANLGALYDQEARFADASAMYLKALALDDSDYQVWGNLGYAYTFGAEPEKARDPFDRAIALAEQQRTETPNDPHLLSRLAGFYAMVDQPGTAHQVLEQAIAQAPRDPAVLSTIGETYEDLGDRDRALEWIGRALERGMMPQFFSTRPMLRDLVADERYRLLVEKKDLVLEKHQL